jgi:hypothetical protein
MRARPAAIAGTLSATVALLVPAASPAAQVELRPAAAAPGSTVVLKGSGFAAGRKVHVSARGVRGKAATASKRGTFSLSLQAPAEAGAVRLVSRSGHRKVANRLVTTAGPAAGGTVEAASSGGARVRMSPATLVPGGTLQFVGRGLRARARVTIAAAGVTHRVRASRHGSFQLALRLPALRSGASTLVRISGKGRGLPLRLRLARPVALPIGAPVVPIVGAPPAAGATAPSGGGGAPAPEPAPAPILSPQNTALPSIGGTPQVGKTLTGGPGTWVGAATIGYAYQWLRCSSKGTSCTAIGSGTKSTYTPTSSDAGKTLALQVTAGNTYGSATATSLPTGVIATQPPPSGTVALWHMDETSGSTMRDSVGSHNGTLSSGVTPGQSGGWTGTAYRFNGTTGRVDVPASNLNPGGKDVTVTLHMKTGLLPPSTVEDWDLFKKGSYDTGNEIKMEYYPTGQASCGFAGTHGGSGTYAEIKHLGPKLDDNKWHEISCTKTSSAITLKVDGKTVDSQSVTIGTISNAEPIVLGSHSAGSEYFNGLIDEVSVRFN